MTSIDQRGQNVKNQVNVGGDAKIGHVGDILNINLPPQFAEALKELLEEEAREDLTQKIEFAEWEPKTVVVEAGPFTMGSPEGKGFPEYETPEFKLDLPVYRIGIYPVTNGQYAAFLSDTNRSAWSELGWGSQSNMANELKDLPVRGVTWIGALAYCRWLQKKTGRPYTLPSEAQWEKAARGPDGNIFPWGDDWQDGKLCNTDSTVVTAVNAFPKGISPYDCYDMVGNIREWTTSLWGRHRHHKLDLRNPYPLTNEWQPIREIKENQQIRRVTRGGASLKPDEELWEKNFGTTSIPEIQLRAARRQSELPYRSGLSNTLIGFRVAMDLEAQE